MECLAAELWAQLELVGINPAAPDTWGALAQGMAWEREGEYVAGGWRGVARWSGDGSASASGSEDGSAGSEADAVEAEAEAEAAAAAAAEAAAEAAGVGAGLGAGSELASARAENDELQRQLCSRAADNVPQ